MNTIEVKFVRALLTADLKASCYRIMLSLWLGQRDLTALKLHEDTLQKSIHELKELGFVEKTKAGLVICPCHLPAFYDIQAAGVLSDFEAVSDPAKAPVPASLLPAQSSLFSGDKSGIDTSITAEKPVSVPPQQLKTPETPTAAAEKADAAAKPAITPVPAAVPAAHPFLSRPAHQQRRVFELWRTHSPRDGRIAPVIDASTGVIPASAAPLASLSYAESLACRLFGSAPAIASARPQ